MRIVGGSLRGRKLASFKHDDIRPTTDRVREAVFNVLASSLPYDSVLDLFAGTGAMGIEALSRFAGKATFVEADRRAADILRKNLKTFGLEFRSKIVRRDAVEFLKTNKEGFDLIILDPPYVAGGGGLIKEIVGLIDAGGLLHEDGRVVVEASSKVELEVELEKLEKIFCRKYGDTAIHIYSNS